VNHRTAVFSGVIPPVVTPLSPGGDVDVASLERLVEFLIDGGADGLFALGSSGETAYLTADRQNTVIETVTGAAAGRVPVLVGAIETTTQRVVERAREARARGAAAIVATAPFYTRTHDTEIDRHFRDIAAAVPLPLLAYDVPVCVHSKLDTALVLRLARDGVLAGIKDSSGDDIGFRRLCRKARDLPGFSLLTGHEVMVDGMLLAGADGVVPGLGNVDPHGYRRLYDAARGGDWETARAEQDRLADLFELVFAPAPGTASGSAGGIGGFKTALMLRGLIASNTVSPPMRPLDSTETAAIAVLLDRAGLR
jgi:4-hydroxy-tetrahydrodipicolinate synthase